MIADMKLPARKPNTSSAQDRLRRYEAVISMFDFKTSDINISSFYFEDILSLSEVQKVQEYKINSISKK